MQNVFETEIHQRILLRPVEIPRLHADPAVGVCGKCGPTRPRRFPLQRSAREGRRRLGRSSAPRRR